MADERKPLARHDPLRLTGIDSRVRVCERRTRGHGCPRSSMAIAGKARRAIDESTPALQAFSVPWQGTPRV